jgi:cytochrome c peroxidase
VSRYAVIASLVAACASPPLVARPDATTSDATADRADTEDASVDIRAPRTASPRCANGVAMPYPEASATPVVGAPLADLRFETTTGSVSLRDWYAPCATTPRLLVIRTLAAWSGRARHAAEHTRRLLLDPRVTLLDLLVLGPDNTPAALGDLPAWRARYDAPPEALAVDPRYRFQALYEGAGELPLYVFVDTRTMRITAALTRPSTADVNAVTARALASIDGLPRPTARPETLIDGRFTRDEWEMIQAMAPAPLSPPADPTNRVADDPRAARLGETLFNDTGLSSNGMVSCATCHASSSLFTDGRAQGVGLTRGDRNTPTVLAAPHMRWAFWDGRVDTLWAQALGPVENPVEMGFTRLAVAHRIADRYATEYTALFGPLPALDDVTRFPPQGMPGTPAWEAMTENDRDAVNRVFVNMGKSIAAYERTLRLPTGAFDRYAMGDMSALSESQRDGLHFFFINGCAQCHFGPTLSNDSFHNIGMPGGRRDGMPDRGRIDATSALMASPFRSDGVFSDDRAVAPHLARIVDDASLLGRFHTPSLRGVSRTGPWGHGGTFTTLAAVVRHYANGLQFPPVAGTLGTRDAHLPWFVDTDSMVVPMVEFLEAL